MTPSSNRDLGFSVSRPAGRLLLSALLLFTLTGSVVWNLPSSELRRTLIPVFRPWFHALGLDQDWGLFSPEPRRLSFLFEARVRFRDGSTETFRPPLGDPFVGLLRGYRWKKWSERVRRDSRRGLWPGTAHHFALRYADDPRGVVAVVLVRRWSESPELGTDAVRTWKEHEFFTLQVANGGAGDG